jgi:hypothetical protein
MRKFTLTLYPRGQDFNVITFSNLRLADIPGKAETALRGIHPRPSACLEMVMDVVDSWRKSIKRKETCQAIGLSGSNPDFALEVRLQ